MCRYHDKVDCWIVQCVLQPHSHPKRWRWRCATEVSLLKPGKPCRLVTTKLSSNITLVHYSQTCRISILMRIFNHGVLLLSYQQSVSTVDKVIWNSIYWLSQPIQKHHPMGCHPGHPIGLWHCLSTRSLLKVHKQISNPIVGWTCSAEIRIQIPSASASRGQA